MSEMAQRSPYLVSAASRFAALLLAGLLGCGATDRADEVEESIGQLKSFEGYV